MMSYDTVRFEVFKRDNFTCQYSGQHAPHVKLNLEHIHPTSKGGTADMWNLLTACESCNQGKRANPLTPEQVRKIDSHVPNIIAQLMAHATRKPEVVDRMFNLSAGGLLFAEWLQRMEALLEELDAEDWSDLGYDEEPV